MAPNVVAKTGAMVPHLRMLAAIELLVAAQAVDLRGIAARGAGRRHRHAHAAVRARVPRSTTIARSGRTSRPSARADRAAPLPTTDLLAR